MYALRLCSVTGLTDWLLLHCRAASGLNLLSQLVGSLVVARNDGANSGWVARVQHSTLTSLIDQWTKVFACVLQFQRDCRVHAENLALGR